MKKSILLIAAMFLMATMCKAQHGIQVSKMGASKSLSYIKCKKYDGTCVTLAFPVREMRKIKTGDTIMIIRDNLSEKWNFDKDYAPNTPMADGSPYYQEYLVTIKNKTN